MRGLLEECFCGVDSWQQWVLPTETSDPQDEGICFLEGLPEESEAGVQVGG